MSVEVVDITIKMGQKKVTLSPEQARELMEALQILLGEDKVIERVVERQPWPFWVRPYHPYAYPQWTVSNNWSGTTDAVGSYTLMLKDEAVVEV